MLQSVCVRERERGKERADLIRDKARAGFAELSLNPQGQRKCKGMNLTKKKKKKVRKSKLPDWIRTQMDRLGEEKRDEVESSFLHLSTALIFIAGWN